MSFRVESRPNRKYQVGATDSAFGNLCLSHTGHVGLTMLIRGAGSLILVELLLKLGSLQSLLVKFIRARPCFPEC